MRKFKYDRHHVKLNYANGGLEGLDALVERGEQDAEYPPGLAFEPWKVPTTGRLQISLHQKGVGHQRLYVKNNPNGGRAEAQNG